jgi:hypothetical protein
LELFEDVGKLLADFFAFSCEPRVRAIDFRQPVRQIVSAFQQRFGLVDVVWRHGFAPMLTALLYLGLVVACVLCGCGTVWLIVMLDE